MALCFDAVLAVLPCIDAVEFLARIRCMLARLAIQCSHTYRQAHPHANKYCTCNPPPGRAC